MFLHLKEKVKPFFPGHHYSEIFHILYDNILVCSLHCYFWFNDIDLVSRSQLCQKHKLQLVCVSQILVHCTFSLNAVWLLHTLKICTIYVTSVKADQLHLFCLSSILGLSKTFTLDLLRHHKYDKWSFAWCYYYWSPDHASAVTLTQFQGDSSVELF